MKPLFLGSHPAMDFLNTSLAPDGTPIELIGDGQSFVAWLVEAGLLDERSASKLKRRFGATDLDEAAAEARKVRQWAAEWLSRWRAGPGGDNATDIRRLNGLLERAKSYREMVVADGALPVSYTHLTLPTKRIV